MGNKKPKNKGVAFKPLPLSSDYQEDGIKFDPSQKAPKSSKKEE